MQLWELEVRESVRQTLADYTAATDRSDLAALAACFGAEAVLEFTGGREPLVGPAAIEAGLGAAMGGPRDAGRPLPTFVRHHVASVRFVSVAADLVEASSYFSVHTDIGLDHWGRYRDVLVPVQQRWLFASRRIAVDGFSKDSLMAQ
ncbi:MAG: nuclear transport factor 2 family protein [Actinomycetota bacterium]|uniref:nuclear transport factor 2 family protein n=1 Tax=Mycolicibacterium sp. S3B2 TaxID=3415120 RepID=UPI002EABFD17|nr:nuclear transport factor 2 family protein [Actinomycetota bacterium]